MITRSREWQVRYPKAALGVLVMDGVSNPKDHADVEAAKSALAEELKAAYAALDRKALNQIPTLQAYKAYYKRFKKSYHVLHQLESVIHKGKPLPGGGALVAGMMMAELKNMLLTAGHDEDALQPPLTIDVARGTETYLRLNGKDQVLKAGDMFIADSEGVISSILYGPDRRTRIRENTSRVLFTVYAPAGIERRAIESHLVDLQENASIASTGATTRHREVLRAG